MPGSWRPARVLVPLVTPSDASGAVALDALESLATQVLRGGAAGVVAPAATGEPTSLDGAERAAVVAACARVCSDHDAVLVVGAGTNTPHVRMPLADASRRASERARQAVAGAGRATIGVPRT